MHIKRDDMVEVISGNDRGAHAKVLKVIAADGKVIVEGVRRVYKHVRRSQRNPQGGRLSKEMPMPMAKVMLICESCGKATRTGARFRPDGSKERYCKKCGAGTGLIAPPRTAHAKK